ncbi:kinesin-like protein KIF1A [Lampetra fluviatilis]
MSAHYINPANDDRQPIDSDIPRTFYRVEAVWDSAVHNSVLLNRVTPRSQRIFLTLTARLQLEGCVEPVVFTKELRLVFFSRATRIPPPRSLRSLFGSPPCPDR